MSLLKQQCLIIIAYFGDLFVYYLDKKAVEI